MPGDMMHDPQKHHIIIVIPFIWGRSGKFQYIENSAHRFKHKLKKLNLLNINQKFRILI